MTIDVDFKLIENYFSFFKAFKLLSLQPIDQDLCSSIFISVLALESLEALEVYGQNCLTGNLSPGLQYFQLTFTSPDEN